MMFIRIILLLHHRVTRHNYIIVNHCAVSIESLRRFIACLKNLTRQNRGFSWDVLHSISSHCGMRSILLRTHHFWSIIERTPVSTILTTGVLTRTSCRTNAIFSVTLGGMCTSGYIYRMVSYWQLCGFNNLNSAGILSGVKLFNLIYLL